MQTISLLSALPIIADPVIIDGTSQPGFAVGAPVIELNGASAGSFTNGLHITAGGSTVRGLVINRFFNNGILLLTNGGNVIEGNFIGLGADGATDLSNAANGITVSTGSNSNTIGGTTAAQRNVVSGNSINGITLAGGVSANIVRGNYVGTNAAGTAPVANDENGIELNNASGNTIGGTAAGAGNLVAFNTTDGVTVTNGTGNSILSNSIHSNGTTANHLGIDLNGDGVNPNDANDADTGANNLQNFPVLASGHFGGRQHDRHRHVQLDALDQQLPARVLLERDVRRVGQRRGAHFLRLDHGQHGCERQRDD